MTTERGRASSGFPIGLTVATAIAFAILIGLGTWQVQRLHWKEALLARIAALQAARARPIDDVLAEVARGADADYTRVTAICPGLPKAPAVELYSIRNGEAGARLVSACRLTGSAYGGVLVDKGFVPDFEKARPAVDPADTTPFELTGVLRKPERGNFMSPPATPGHWFVRDVPAMAVALHADHVAPLTLMAETPTNPEFKALTPAPIPVDIPNRHLEYAITWYGLAAALLGVYAAMLLKRRS